jgi:threonine/homoserine/homoserine lactone efflux protein
VVAQPALRWGILGGGVGYLLWLAWRLAGSRALAQVDASPAERQLFPGRAAAVSQHQGLDAGAVRRGRLDCRAPRRHRAHWLQVLPLMLAFGFFSNLTYATTGSLLRGWLAHGQRLLVFNRCMARPWC